MRYKNSHFAYLQL